MNERRKEMMNENNIALLETETENKINYYEEAESMRKSGCRGTKQKQKNPEFTDNQEKQKFDKNIEADHKNSEKQKSFLKAEMKLELSDIPMAGM